MVYINKNIVIIGVLWFYIIIQSTRESADIRHTHGKILYMTFTSYTLMD